MRIKTVGALAGIGAAVLALGVISGNGGFSTSTDTGDRRSIIRAEVEASGPFHVTLTSDSSVHGRREHADGAYSKTYAEDIEVRSGETVAVYLTSALDIDRNRRQRNEVRISVNGKTVCSKSVTTRAGEVPQVADCFWRHVG